MGSCLGYTRSCKFGKRALPRFWGARISKLPTTVNLGNPFSSIAISSGSLTPVFTKGFIATVPKEDVDRGSSNYCYELL